MVTSVKLVGGGMACNHHNGLLLPVELLGLAASGIGTSPSGEDADDDAAFDVFPARRADRRLLVKPNLLPRLLHPLLRPLMTR